MMFEKPVLSTIIRFLHDLSIRNSLIRVAKRVALIILTNGLVTTLWAHGSSLDGASGPHLPPPQRPTGVATLSKSVGMKPMFTKWVEVW